MVSPKTQAEAPMRSLDQRMEALKRANDIRVRVKAARFLNTCRISQSKTVGGLSDRQRTELIGLFNR
jgi:hypothetical protein